MMTDTMFHAAITMAAVVIEAYVIRNPVVVGARILQERSMARVTAFRSDDKNNIYNFRGDLQCLRKHEIRKLKPNSKNTPRY